MLKTDPAPFMSARAAKLVTAGNIEDDLAQAADSDWIVEAVIERLDIKQQLYRKLDAVRKPGTAVSSNTSTIPLAQLTDGQSAAFKRDFLITHFFNPPRYMRLLEIVTGPETDAALAARVAECADFMLGKSIVRCKDSPGFIANRLGIYWLQVGVVEAIDAGLTVEEADAVIGKPVGVPKTGVFGLIDLVGLDLMPHINGSLAKALPASDAFHAANRDLPLIKKMIAEGFTGRKGKGGLSSIKRSSGSKLTSFVAFLAYCLHVTLRARLRPLAGGLTPRAVLDKFAAIQMLDVHFPTTEGRTLILSRYTELNADQKLLASQLNLEMPPQPPPRITAAGQIAKASTPAL